MYRVPSRHPGSQRMVFSSGARVPQRGALHGCSQPGMRQRDPLDVPRQTRGHRSRASGRCEKPTRHSRWVRGIPHRDPQEAHRLNREHRSNAPWRCEHSSQIKSAHTTLTRGPPDPRHLVTRPSHAKSRWNSAPSILMRTKPRPRGKKKCPNFLQRPAKFRSLLKVWVFFLFPLCARWSTQHTHVGSSFLPTAVARGRKSSRGKPGCRPSERWHERQWFSTP